MELVFRALADGGRRALLDGLRERNGQTLLELCELLPELSRQGVTKHLRILEDANLVVTVKQGRNKLHYLNPVPINEIAERWLSNYERDKLTALSALKAALENRAVEDRAVEDRAVEDRAVEDRVDEDKEK
ncbi:ArsR/SmtB family transcription factor [Kribbella sp. NPDC058245]|uniref:ArsR/SmtB family transcription factor n=1 Tax=Kribbella sp. NPDC058245 TaxID=3346399 RepID=UPI0036EF9C34